MKHAFYRRQACAWSWLLLVLPCAAIAATTSPLQKEIAAAKIHAQVAAHADSLKMVQLHLHHVINCMVGARGNDYSAAAEALAAVPCTGPGLGNGAAADSSADPALHTLMREVLQNALAGVHAQALPAARQDADHVLKLLDQAGATHEATPHA